MSVKCKWYFLETPIQVVQRSFNLLFQCTFFLICPFFQKYLNLQNRTNKLLTSAVYHLCPSILASSPPLKTQGQFFWKSVSPKTKGVEEAMIYFIKIQSENMKMTWNISLFILCMICNFSECDGFTILWIISIKRCGFKFIVSSLQPW